MFASLAKSLVLGIGLTCAAMTAGVASDASAANSRTILTVTGSVGADASANEGKTKVEYDRAALKAVGASTLETTTPWTKGVVRFEGVAMKDLLEHLGAEGETLNATALNGYSISVPMDELFEYPVLLAYEMDGKAMSVRDKGPLWLIYPRDQFDRFMSEEHNYKWIWQIRRFEVE